MRHRKQRRGVASRRHRNQAIPACSAFDLRRVLRDRRCDGVIDPGRRPGQFHILGTMVGVLLIGIIDNGLSILGVATFWQYIVQGLLLISSLFASGILKLRKT
jgi:hypothetical protein